jgi:hypothetical protein
MGRPSGSLAIGDRVWTPKGTGRVVGRRTASESMAHLGREERSLEAMRLQAAYGECWQSLFFIYTVEMDKGPPEMFESSMIKRESDA